EMAPALGGMQQVAVSHDGKQLLVLAATFVRVADTRTGDVVRTLAGPTRGRRELERIALQPKGRWLAEGWETGVNLWDVASKRLLRRLKGHRKVVTCLAFAADGTLLLVGDHRGSVTLWDMARLEVVFEWGAHKPSPVSSVAFGPDGKTVATAGEDGERCV